MRHALLGMASCALALSLGVGIADAAESKANFKATRDITVDSVTGKVRKPDSAELAKLVADLKAMTRQTSLAAPGATLPNGARYLNLDGGHAGVMLARPNPDGTWDTRCVFTFEEAAAFLGLVSDDAQ